MNKELSAGMLEYTKSPIPTTLTLRGFEVQNDDSKPSKEEIAKAKDLKKMALNLFKNILGCVCQTSCSGRIVKLK